MRGKLEKEPSMERSSLSPTAFKSDLCSDIGSEGAMAGGAGGSIGSPRFGSPVRTGRYETTCVYGKKNKLMKGDLELVYEKKVVFPFSFSLLRKFELNIYTNIRKDHMTA